LWWINRGGDGQHTARLPNTRPDASRFLSKESKMAHDWEWVIEVHPNHQCDIEDTIECQDVKDINHYLSHTDDPVEVQLSKRFYRDDKMLTRIERNYVDLVAMEFDPSQRETEKIPTKFLDQLQKMKKPVVVHDPSKCECCGVVNN
jgi:hypothetical protein